MQIATCSDGLYQDSIGIIEKQMEITISIGYTHINTHMYWGYLGLGVIRNGGSKGLRIWIN